MSRQKLLVRKAFRLFGKQLLVRKRLLLIRKSNMALFAVASSFSNLSRSDYAAMRMRCYSGVITDVGRLPVSVSVDLMCDQGKQRKERWRRMDKMRCRGIKCSKRQTQNELWISVETVRISISFYSALISIGLKSIRTCIHLDV